MCLQFANLYMSGLTTASWEQEAHVPLRCATYLVAVCSSQPLIQYPTTVSTELSEAIMPSLWCLIAYSSELLTMHELHPAILLYRSQDNNSQVGKALSNNTQLGPPL